MDQIKIIYEKFIGSTGICTDTRAILTGGIFFALKGSNFNGNTFAKQALDSGSILVVMDEDPGFIDSRIIQVDDALSTLQQLANYHRMLLKIPFIAITGSNGKTTTKELISRVLAEKYRTLFTKGNLNNHIGVPLTLLSVTKEHQIAVIEMGANHQQEIEMLCNIAQPTHVLITNIGKAHLEGFGGFEGVKKGKGEMYAYAKANEAVIFINDDNPILKEMLGTYDKKIKYGNASDCNISGKQLTGNSYVHLEWRKKEDSGYHLIKSQITGNYNFENILSSITIGSYFGIEEAAIKRAIENYIPDNQRSQELVKGTIKILLDAYNANPTSMEAALRNFKTGIKGKSAIFLGDMLELGEEAEKEHLAIIRLVESYKFDLVVLVGANFKLAGNNFKANYFNTSAEALTWLRSQDLNGYQLLIKGSRGSKMEVLLDGLNSTT
ncbi:MAG: UDP-N-acetylmuramoyl-tripeptide--D-alanyl-D-alanine ligase [Bacteroidetes bacterium]|nr:UDP-N-acetylmuramoyl-tripeptide--D-alanyl-D-alanine ligase [Bacteroidota bacterium]